MLTYSIDEEQNEDLGPGKLVLPVTIGPVATVCFLPCGGMDRDTEELPVWADKVDLTKLYASFDEKLHSTVWNEGKGKSQKRRTQTMSICSREKSRTLFSRQQRGKKSIHDWRKRQFSGREGRIGHLRYGLEGISEKASIIQNWEGTLRTWRPQGDSEQLS